MSKTRLAQLSLLSNDKNYDLDFLCPTGFKFLTNYSWGDRKTIFHPNKGKDAIQYIEDLKSLGYIVQITDPIDIHGAYYSEPDFQAIAIYIKKANGTSINWEEL
jgi:hypothetical protein